MMRAMLLRGLVVVVGLIFATSVLLAFIPTIINKGEEARTAEITQTGLQCTTASGATSCSVSLSNAHEYSTTSYMTVTETAPGSVNRTANTTLNSARTAITVSGLSGSTTYTFTVEYVRREPLVSAELNDLLKLSPPLVVLGLIALAVIAGGIVVATGRSRA